MDLTVNLEKALKCETRARWAGCLRLELGSWLICHSFTPRSSALSITPFGVELLFIMFAHMFRSKWRVKLWNDTSVLILKKKFIYFLQLIYKVCRLSYHLDLSDVKLKVMTPFCCDFWMFFVWLIKSRKAGPGVCTKSLYLHPPRVCSFHVSNAEPRFFCELPPSSLFTPQGRVRREERGSWSFCVAGEQFVSQRRLNERRKTHTHIHTAYCLCRAWKVQHQPAQGSSQGAAGVTDSWR